MEKQNSPVIRSNTPMRRMGLSRKRKSFSCQNMSPKIRFCGDKYPDTPTQSEKSLEKTEPNCTKDCEDGDNPAVNYDYEIEVLKRKISEAEEKLKTLQSNKDNITQLEDLIGVWKSGCKKAYLQFSQFVQERQTENVDLKAVLSSLGVLETLVENFNSDPEISLPD